MPAFDAKPPIISSAFAREISTSQRAITLTQEELSKCGMWDTVLGTRAALTADLQLERKRLADLAVGQSKTLTPQEEKAEVKMIRNSHSEERARVNAAMSDAVTHANVAYTGTLIVNQVGFSAVEMGSVAIAGPAVGAGVGLLVRGASNVGQTIAEGQIGSGTNFQERLASDVVGAGFSFAGGKLGQHAASAMHGFGGKALSTIGASVAGGITMTAAQTGEELTLRQSRGEDLLQNGDLRRWGINAAASSASWALGDHGGKFTTALGQTTKAVALAAGSSTIAVAADYATTGEFGASTVAHGISSALGANATSRHLASRNYKVAPVTGIKGALSPDITPAGHSILSLRDDGGGAVSIHLENPKALIRGEVTIPAVKKEFSSLMKAASEDPRIKTVRVSSPILAKMSPDGDSATLRTLGRVLMEEHGGVPHAPTLTPDLQKISMTTLETLRSIPTMSLKEPVSKLGDHEYTVGFDIPMKERK